MKLVIDDKRFMREMNNFVAYAEGFLDGAHIGKPMLLRNIGEELKVLASEYIDSSASVDPQSLHHVYEWYRVGSPSARLFDINYAVVNGGLTIGATLTQSSSIPNGSNVPFYNKAKIMESGVPVTITPVNSEVLRFEQDGATVFTRNSVTVDNPGGEATAGSFEATLKEFFTMYLSQSMMFASGLGERLRNPIDFKKNAGAGKRGGRAVGVRTGQAWISGGIK